MIQSRVFRQIVLVLVTLALLGFVGGGFLEGVKEKFANLPGLIVMVPPLIDLRGNIGSALGSRLGTALHLGLIKPRWEASKVLKVNVVATLLLSILLSFAVGVFSYLVCHLANIEASLAFLVFAAVFTGAVSGAVIVFTTIFVAVESYRRGWDPDNVTGPVMTTIGDLATILSLVLAVVIW